MQKQPVSIEILLTVIKSRYNVRLDLYEYIREIDEVPEDKVFVEMACDQPYEQNATYLYEGGKYIGNRFTPEFIWYSENPHLFD